MYDMNAQDETPVTDLQASSPSPRSEWSSRMNTIHRYVTGDVPGINEWMQNKPVIVQFPNWFLRGVGAPIFLNNPLSGALIFAAMFVGGAWLAICGGIGLMTAIITARLLEQPQGDIQSGGVTFHGMLIGIVLATALDLQDWYPWTIFPIIVLSVISVYVASGLGAIFSRCNLPALNLPFVLTTFLFLASVNATRGPNDHFPTKVGASLGVNETFANSDIKWDKLFEPIALSLSQIYGSTELAAGILILVGMLVASPILCIHAMLASVVSVFTALSLAAPPVEIYSGQWSYNAVLTCASLGGFFFVLTPQTHILALLSAAFSTVTYGAMRAFLNPSGLPVIAFPFVLVTSIFLSVGSESKDIRRVPMDSLSYPEKHRRDYKSSSVNGDVLPS